MVAVSAATPLLMPSPSVLGSISIVPEAITVLLLISVQTLLEA